MDDRQKARRRTVGKRLARARRAAGHRSQAAFAASIGIHETSVARAEAGHTNVGADVFTHIEVGLRLPDDVISRYLETGDDQLLESITYPPKPIPSSLDDPENRLGHPEPEPDDEGWTEADQELMDAIHKFAQKMGIERVTATLINALRDEWEREKAERDQADQSG